MATATTPARPPFPPFTRDSAMQKVRLAEDAWNTRDPAKVALAYTIDSRWRNRSEFINGRNEVIAFLSRKWAMELDYRLIKEMWAFTGNRIAVRFAYEWRDDSDHWHRSYGNENWEFSDDGLMASRFASINDIPILESERKYHWALGRRPDDHPGLSDLGLQFNCPFHISEGVQQPEIRDWTIQFSEAEFGSLSSARRSQGLNLNANPSADWVSFPVHAKIRSGRSNEFAQLAGIQSSLGKSRLA